MARVPYPRKRDHHVSTISAYKAAAADGREAELHDEETRFDKHNVRRRGAHLDSRNLPACQGRR
jgi:hypothetical protein